MAPYSIAFSLMPDLDQLEKMNQDLTKMMPREMASAVNLMAHPMAGTAAMSALSVGLANHAFGLWMGTLSGAIEASHRHFQHVAFHSARPICRTIYPCQSLKPCGNG